MRTAKFLGVVLMLGTLILVSASAVCAYPSKPIRLIVPFSPGGLQDRLGRYLARSLGQQLGVKVPVNNVLGAGGLRGAAYLSRSRPDGYTIGLVQLFGLQLDDILRMRKTSIDYKGFKIIVGFSDTKQFVYVNKRSPIRTLEDLRRVRRPLKFATTAVGTKPWFQANALEATLHFPVKFIASYRDLPQAAFAVARGEAEAGTGRYIDLRELLDDLRPLALISDRRDPNLPDIPTTTDLQYENLPVLGVSRILGAPPGTPDYRLQVIRDAVKQDAAFHRALQNDFSLGLAEPAATQTALKANARIVERLGPELKPLLR